MLIEPSINDLLEKVDSRYTLVVAVSKRAREIIADENRREDIENEKPVTLATLEMAEDKLTYYRP